MKFSVIQFLTFIIILALAFTAFRYPTSVVGVTCALIGSFVFASATTTWETSGIRQGIVGGVLLGVMLGVVVFFDSIVTMFRASHSGFVAGTIWCAGVSLLVTVVVTPLGAAIGFVGGVLTSLAKNSVRMGFPLKPTLLSGMAMVFVLLLLCGWHWQSRRVQNRAELFHRCCEQQRLSEAFQMMADKYRSDHSLKDFERDSGKFDLSGAVPHADVSVFMTTATVLSRKPSWSEVYYGYVFYWVYENGDWYCADRSDLSLD
ncbi:MAG: hypothetical protein AAF497_22800 [Planctomycetota bacterium]